MIAETPVAKVEERGTASSLVATRAARHLKTQVENWYAESRSHPQWEDENLIDEPTPERLAEHARRLDELERVGRWLASATQSTDFPDRPTAELVVLALQDLADGRAMWHGRS